MLSSLFRSTACIVFELERGTRIGQNHWKALTQREESSGKLIKQCHTRAHWLFQRHQKPSTQRPRAG